MTATTTPVAHASRAVLREVQAGSMVSCTHCLDLVAFRARERPKQVICNVYNEDRWVRIEHYHHECYGAAGAPYGEPADIPQRRQPAQR